MDEQEQAPGVADAPRYGHLRLRERRLRRRSVMVFRQSAEELVAAALRAPSYELREGGRQWPQVPSFASQRMPNGRRDPDYRPDRPRLSDLMD